MKKYDLMIMKYGPAHIQDSLPSSYLVTTYTLNMHSKGMITPHIQSSLTRISDCTVYTD